MREILAAHQQALDNIGFVHGDPLLAGHLDGHDLLPRVMGAAALFPDLTEGYDADRVVDPASPRGALPARDLTQQSVAAGDPGEEQEFIAVLFLDQTEGLVVSQNVLNSLSIVFPRNILPDEK